LVEGRVIVLSDTHFGDPGATLGVRRGAADEGARRRHVDRFVAALAARGPVAEVVLLGDVFEMWTASFQEAVSAARYFFESLAVLDPGRVVLVIGNHDYHLLVQHREDRLRDDVARGERPADLLPIQQTFRDSYLAGLLPASLRDRLVVTYPNYRVRIDGVQYVFHHGHHLATIRGGDVFALGPRFILERLERVRADDMTLRRLERGSHVFFEMSYVIGMSTDLRARLLEFWSRLVATRHAVQAARAFLFTQSGHRNLAINRGTALWDVANFREPARRYLRLMADETGETWQPDVLVFGHTHRQGIAEVEPVPGPEERVREALQGELDPLFQPATAGRDFHLVNTGCWLREEDKPNEGHIDIVAVVERGSAGLYRFTPEGLEALERLVVQPVAAPEPVREPA
jgi:UDP-2,3-diacylglucosamine pyrophosphatase LpxH